MIWAPDTLLPARSIFGGIAGRAGVHHGLLWGVSRHSGKRHSASLFGQSVPKPCNAALEKAASESGLATLLDSPLMLDSPLIASLYAARSRSHLRSHGPLARRRGGVAQLVRARES